MQIVVSIVTALLMLAGLIGSVVPGVPGPILVLAGALLYAWYGDFLIITWGTLGILALLAAVGQVLDYAASLIGARVFGAGRWGVIGACLGAFVGFLVASIPGALAGLFLGACCAEFIRGRDLRRACIVGSGTIVGFFAGTLGKCIITGVMIVVFILRAF